MKHYLRTIHRDFAKAGLVHGRDFIQQACIYDEVDLIGRKGSVTEDISGILTEGYTKISRELGMTCTYTGEVMIGPDWFSCH